MKKIVFCLWRRSFFCLWQPRHSYFIHFIKDRLHVSTSVGRGFLCVSDEFVDLYKTRQRKARGFDWKIVLKMKKSRKKSSDQSFTIRSLYFGLFGTSFIRLQRQKMCNKFNATKDEKDDSTSTTHGSYQVLIKLIKSSEKRGCLSRCRRGASPSTTWLSCLNTLSHSWIGYGNSPSANSIYGDTGRYQSKLDLKKNEEQIKNIWVRTRVIPRLQTSALISYSCAFVGSILSGWKNTNKTTLKMHLSNHRTQWWKTRWKTSC